MMATGITATRLVLRGSVGAVRYFYASAPSSSSSSSRSSTVSGSSSSDLATTAKLLNFRTTLPADVAKPVSLSTASQREITKFKVNEAILNIQQHGGDTGSAPVQIAVMTEKVVNLARHFAMHKKDKHSQRGFEMLLARRRKMMKYLKKYDFATYKQTIQKLGLEKEASSI